MTSLTQSAKNLLRGKSNPLSFFNKLNTSGNAQNARLFFYTDDFQLGVAVIAREDEQLKILASAYATEIAEGTLEKVIADISAQVSKLPDRVILIHSRLALGLLDLPVTDNKQLTEDKKASIIRWEMETLYGEQSPQWSIGSFLVQVGIITDTERDAIIKIQQQNRLRAASSGGKLPRFGEIAVSQDKLDQKTLEKYLALQNEFQQDDTQVQCGWHQSDQEANLFCAAMSAKEHSRWINQFDALNLRIDRFYPVSGALSALISAEPLQCILELHSGSMVFSILEQGVVQSIDIVNTLEHSLTLKDLLNTIQQHDKPFTSLYLWGDHPRTMELFEQLKESLDIAIVFLPWPAEKLVADSAAQTEPFLYPLLGVAQDYFFQKLNNGRIPYVQGMLPPPRFYQQKKWQAGVAVLSIILLMMAINGYLKGQVVQAQTEVERLKENHKLLKKNNKKLVRDNSKYNRLEVEFNTLKETFAALQVQKKAVEVNLIERQKFMRDFLSLLIKSVDKDVVLDSLTEDQWYHFRLTGWALNLAAVNRFERSLTRHLGLFDMIISKSPSRLLKSGELAGAYRFNFQLTRKKRGAQ